MEADFSWMYLIIFLMIPLARILPRILKKLKSGNSESQEIPQRQFESNFNRYEDQSDKQFESNSTEYQEPPKSSKPQTKNMLVLGELHRGVKQFEDIQKNTGLTTEELNSILEDLENNGLMKAQQKSGLFGMKTELVPTDKGFKEYYS
jgi:predicted Rossmann fold nucleotide-binding protein DprA/Smf involved in DNA uptake|tara:strand:- start:213 stop:656 length:444 start_codon:yes stop_codon:yes gene_type:complete